MMGLNSKTNVLMIGPHYLDEISLVKYYVNLLLFNVVLVYFCLVRRENDASLTVSEL